MDKKLLDEKETMSKLCYVRISNDDFVELFNKVVSGKGTQDSILEAGLDKDVILQKILAYRKKHRMSAAFDLAILNFLCSEVKDYIDNKNYKREMFVYDLINNSAIYLCNVLGLSNF